MSQEETGTSVNAENIAFGKSAIKKSSLSLAERLGLVATETKAAAKSSHIVVDTDICNSRALTSVPLGYAQPTAHTR